MQTTTRLSDQNANSIDLMTGYAQTYQQEGASIDAACRGIKAMMPAYRTKHSLVRSVVTGVYEA